MAARLWPKVLTAIVAGGVAAIVGFIPFLLSGLVSGLLAHSIAWRGQGSAGSAVVVEIVQLGLFGLVAGAVAAAVRFLTCQLVRQALSGAAHEAARAFSRTASVWATAGTLVGMVASGHLRVRATIPLIGFSDSSRGTYMLIGPFCAVVFALLGMGTADFWRRVK